MNPRAFLAVLLILASGCIGAASPAPTHTTPSVEKIPTLNATPNATLVSMTNSTPVTFDGALNRSAEFCSVPEGLVAICPADPLSDSDTVQFYKGANYTHAHVALSWTATTTATQELNLSFLALRVSEDHRGVSSELVCAAQGASPLVLDCKATPGADEPVLVGLFVNLVDLSPAPDKASIYASMDQPFHLGGTLSSTMLMPAEVTS